MRGWRARAGAAAVLLAVTLSVTAAVGAAAAAGRDQPDVAVVVAAGGRTEAEHAGQAGFDRLRELLEPERDDTEPVPEEWTRGRYPRVRFTVLWGLTGVGGWPQTHRAPGGDVAMLRQDQLFLAGDGTPWVRTDPAPDVTDDDIRRHRAPRRVYDRLAGDRLLGPGEAPAAAGDGAGGVRDRAVWAAAGLAAGVAATLLLRRAAARRSAGPPPEPRQELIDL
ncbi:hypothetical protein [Streptomyces sp. NBC_00557]|uniref:hypothetical protein n=1 Tax=Streptomyces sp. NBC_00557 TaxID=2975776 RepID=UPI002E7FCD02|nr:hypothetical protein [Streptomyces sp. NBC_00557]WUC35149.1 hypothetical protein OG956_13420 [Streptomyces sp. NBC_00557]